MTTQERLAVLDKLADHMGELCRTLNFMTDELLDLANDMRAEINAVPIRDPRQSPLQIGRRAA